MILHNDLLSILSDINKDGVNGKTINPTDDLFKLGVLDSLTIVQLIVALEKKFKIKISSKDISFDSFSNLNNMEKLIQNKLDNIK